MDLREEGGMENWEESKKGKLCLICDPREKNLFKIQMTKAFLFYLIQFMYSFKSIHIYLYTY